MDKKVLVLSRKEERVGFDTADSIVDGLNGTAYESCYLDELSFLYDGNDFVVENIRSGRQFTEYKTIFAVGWHKERLHEDIMKACALIAHKTGSKLINSEAFYMRSRSKLSQYVMAALEGVSITPFCYAMNAEALTKLLRGSSITFPFILKAPLAARGNDNYLVKDRDELQKILKNNPTKTFIAQTFVPNDGDLRLIVLGGEVKLAIKRTSNSGSHLTNTSKGGSAELVEISQLPEAMTQEAIKVAALLKREVTGVDMIVDKNTGKHYFLEANNMPHLSVGAFVPEKMAVLRDYLASVST